MQCNFFALIYDKLASNLNLAIFQMWIKTERSTQEKQVCPSLNGKSRREI